MEQGQFPGAVVLVSHDGQIVKLSAYGYADVYSGLNVRLANPVPMREDTIFDLASLTKTFTATAVMRLVDEGRIGLDTQASQYLS